MLHLDHTIVLTHDQDKSARFIARMFGLTFEGRWGRFSPVHIDDHLSLDFADREGEFPGSHYAFLASDEEFDAILGRVKSEGIPFGSGPRIVDDMEINHKHQGRGFYFRDAHDGHSWEVITHTYV
jgi:catechol 2,3-dioxygenase-like lactoylglutathione lyase family enzyme